jgi:hypothetical protein
MKFYTGNLKRKAHKCISFPCWIWNILLQVSRLNNPRISTSSEYCSTELAIIQTEQATMSHLIEICYCCDSVRLHLCGTAAANGPIVHPQMISLHEWIWSSGGMILTGENRRSRRKTCPSATLSTTNPTWTVLGTNPGLNPATNSLWYGSALIEI